VQPEEPRIIEAKEVLAAKEVFIDTSFFRASGFALQNPSFTKFARLCQDKVFVLLTTDITEREIQKHAKEHAREAFGGFQKFRDKASVVGLFKQRYESKPIRNLSAEDLIGEMQSAVEQFFNTAGAKILPIAAGATQRVFDNYFNSQPPFTESGKKKCEFPDAFVLDALTNYSASGRKIYIISGDGDFRSACKGNKSFIFLESLEALLDVYNQHEALSTFVHQLVKKNADKIKDNIAQQLGNATFELRGGGELEDFIIKSVTMPGVSLIELLPNEATFQLRGKFNITARVSMVDEFDYYERVMGRMPRNNGRTVKLHRPLDYKAFLTVNFKNEADHSFEMFAIELQKESFVLDGFWKD
jgi:hypothetical protein